MFGRVGQTLLHDAIEIDRDVVRHVGEVAADLQAVAAAAARLGVPHAHQLVEAGDQPVLVQSDRPQLAQDAVQRFHHAADRAQHCPAAGAQRLRLRLRPPRLVHDAGRLGADRRQALPELVVQFARQPPTLALLHGEQHLRQALLFLRLLFQIAGHRVEHRTDAVELDQLEGRQTRVEIAAFELAETVQHRRRRAQRTADAEVDQHVERQQRQHRPHQQARDLAPHSRALAVGIDAYQHLTHLQAGGAPDVEADAVGLIPQHAPPHLHARRFAAVGGRLGAAVDAPVQCVADQLAEPCRRLGFRL